jgi:hypothetical protein
MDNIILIITHLMNSQMVKYKELETLLHRHQYFSKLLVIAVQLLN